MRSMPGTERERHLRRVSLGRRSIDSAAGGVTRKAYDAAAPGGPGEWTTDAERRVRMAGAVEKIMQHLVTDHHLALRPVGGDEDLVAGLPVSGARAAGAGEAVSGNHLPPHPIEVADQAGACLGLRPPFAVEGRRIHRHVARGIEAAGDHTQKDRCRYEAEEKWSRHVTSQGNRRAADRPTGNRLTGNDKDTPIAARTGWGLSRCESRDVSPRALGT
jgi:hypothetical protein